MTKKKYKLGLALSGGGAKGFAHCGALMALEEFGLKPDVIAGTSAGAIVGALYAAGNKPQEISKMFMGKEFSNFVKFLIPKAGFFDHSPFMDFLMEYLHVKTFEELQIPLHIVASDLDHGQSKVFTTGELARCVLASCSVPVIFNPVEIDGVHYVDGGIFRNFPVVPIRDLCEKVIGINVSPLISDEYKQNMIHIAQRSYHFMFKANTFEDKALCDMLVEVEEAHQYGAFDLENITQIFRLGYEDTVRTLEETYGLTRVIPPHLLDMPSPKTTKKSWKKHLDLRGRG
ncbi:MAG: patatin-like phospholipase family protein [Bacteroidales bacterium]